MRLHTIHEKTIFSTKIKNISVIIFYAREDYSFAFPFMNPDGSWRGGLFLPE